MIWHCLPIFYSKSILLVPLKWLYSVFGLQTFLCLPTYVIFQSFQRFETYLYCKQIERNMRYSCAAVASLTMLIFHIFVNSFGIFKWQNSSSSYPQGQRKAICHIIPGTRVIVNKPNQWLWLFSNQFEEIKFLEFSLLVLKNNCYSSWSKSHDLLLFVFKLWILFLLTLTTAVNFLYSSLFGRFFTLVQNIYQHENWYKWRATFTRSLISCPENQSNYFKLWKTRTRASATQLISVFSSLQLNLNEFFKITFAGFVKQVSAKLVWI